MVAETRGGGSDFFQGGGDDELFKGSNGDDKLKGSNGDDTLNGGEGSDTLNGGQGNDYLIGGQGDDYMIGGQGNDHLSAGPGFDRLAGGPGNDIFYFNGQTTAGDRNIIVDYEDGDRVVLRDGLAIASVEDSGVGAVVTLNNDAEIVFRGLSADDVGNDVDFIF